MRYLDHLSSAYYMLFKMCGFAGVNNDATGNTDLKESLLFEFYVFLLFMLPILNLRKKHVMLINNCNYILALNTTQFISV